MSNAIQHLKSLIAPGTGCGPLGAAVRVAIREGCLCLSADVEHPIAELPAPDAPLRGAPVDVGIRVEGPTTREFHVAYFPRFDRERPALKIWGGPRVDLDPDNYTSSQRVVDDTHYTFHVRIPLSLLGPTEGKLGCKTIFTGYRGGNARIIFLSTGEGPRLPGWDGESGFALLDDEVTFTLGRLEQLMLPRASSCLKTDTQLGVDRLPPLRQAPPVTDGSDRVSLDGDWRFSGTRAQSVEPADAWRSWPIIRIPGHHALQNLLLDGVGRWVKEFRVPRHFSGRRALLRLDSIEGEAEVTLNGARIAVIDNPYLPNQLDVTDVLRPGELNLLQVTASHGGHLNAATGRAATSLFPDISGRVWLEILPAAWLENLVCDTDAEGGLRLSWLAGGDGAVCQLSVRLLDATMTPVWQASAPVEQGKLETRLADVRLWHPEHPQLYTLELELRRDETRVARYAMRVGFRSVQAASRKLLLNGREIKWFGSNHHTQQPLTGWWMREDEHRRDAALYRDANVNGLRLWPLSEAFLDACDELGMMVQMEIPISFFNDSGNEFNPEDNSARKRNPAVRDANVERTRRFLLQYRNRACVCLWSVGNESGWDDSFEASARVIKRLDPHRPVLVSGVGATGLGVPVLDIDTEHYPLNRGHQFTPGTGQRPICHTEWSHLSCRNVGELAIDPGLHDRYVDALRRNAEHTRRNDVGCIGGDLFTGVDVATYAYPDGYPAERDHVPCLGFIDRWRRPAPEYHHVWKLFSPVELLDPRPESRAGKLVFRQLENRSTASALTDYRFTWRDGRERGEAILQPNGELHLSGAVHGDLELSCWDAAGRLVNRWRYPAPPPPVSRVISARSLRVTEEAGGLLVEPGDLRWQLRKDELPVALRPDGERAAWDVGRLLVTAGANNPPSGLAREWRGSELRLESATADEIVVALRGRYAEAEGGYRLRFLADGRVVLGYRFEWQGAGLRVRELGVAFRVPRGCERLRWERDAEWSWYPADHIGRPVGDTLPFPDPRALRAGPWEVPTWPWAHDATTAGSKDFRSTKRFIRAFSLTTPCGAGLALEAGGDRHARAWLADDHVGAQCCHFTGRSAEDFIDGVDLAELNLKRGTIIESESLFRIL